MIDVKKDLEEFDAAINLERETCEKCPLFGHPKLCLLYRIERHPSPTREECEARYHWRVYEEYARHALVWKQQLSERLKKLKEKLSKKNEEGRKS